jgi:RimJ/RimL family protein N-acetyltransferase
MTTLETPRLLMRPVEPADLDHFVALYADADVMRFIGKQGPLPPELVQARVDFMVDHWRRHGFGMWALFTRAGGDFVGRCGLRYMDNTTEVELGYTLRKAYWGQGLATEASRAVVGYAFDVLQLRRLVAIADPGHAASIHVMKKVGMTYERMGHFYDSDCVLYAMTGLASGGRQPPDSVERSGG